MSNRRRPRATKALPDGGFVVYPGVEQFIPSGAVPHDEPAMVPGQHSWIAAAAFRVVDPEAEPINLDRENLLSLNLGCYACEQPYSEALAAQPCGGEPS